MASSTITLFLAGDVMTGRGVDQILPHPGAAELRESYLRDARDYVALAEEAHGPIPHPVDPAWPWGDALAMIGEAEPDVRVVNLETSVTGDGSFAPDKGIHYRMHPDNIGCLTAADLDVCVLANNHVLDFGVAGLTETLQVVNAAGLRTAGAGLNAAQAWQPAEVDMERGRVLVFSAGLASSGISPANVAGPDLPGLAFLPDLSEENAARFVGHVNAVKRDGDLTVASLHWGTNWGYEVPLEHVRFAHWLVDGGIDVVHGHSSHHPRPLEIYRGRPILYGCGDLINDYEGIGGHQQFRDDLRLLYFATLDVSSRALRELRLIPVLSRRMRLKQASKDDGEWLRGVLGEASAGYGTRISVAGDGSLSVGVP